MSEFWIVLKTELRQQLRDRRALVGLFLPALFAPVVCLLAFLTLSAPSEMDRKELSVSSTDINLESSQILPYISASLDEAKAESTVQHDWHIRWSTSPWDDLVRGESDVALILEEGRSWKIVPSPIPLDAASLTTEIALALGGQELPNGSFGNPPLPSSPGNTGPQIPVTDFFGETAATLAIASYLLPALLIPMFTLPGGAVAVESIAAEKEHGTFESLRALGAPGLSIIMGKLGAVALTSATSGGLVVFLALCAGHVRPRGLWNLGMDYVVEAGIDAGSGFMLGVLTLSALILSSAMWLFLSGVAKTRREAQQWVMIMAIVPVSLGSWGLLSHGNLTEILKIIPFANVATGLSETITGNYDGWSLAICLAVNAAVSAALIGSSTRMLFGKTHLRNPSVLS